MLELLQATQKKTEGCPSNQVTAAAMTSASEEIKTLEAQVGQFLLSCKCPVSRGIVVQEQDPLGDLPAAFFLQNVLQMHQQRWVILRVDSLVLWKIINEEDAVLIPPKKIEARTFPADFWTRKFFDDGSTSVNFIFQNEKCWYREIRKSSITFLPQKRDVYEIMWKNIVQPDRPQMAIWRMRIACWITKATGTHS